jgi:beta-glucuronidase
MQRDIMLIKDTGANCVRTCHYPNDERFLDLCDENGLFVWEEAHGRGLNEDRMRNPHFLEQSRLSITEMITEHYNHPSIFVWGLLNECASDTAYGRSCYAELIELIRSLDRSKPVTFASCKLLADICLDLVDIVSYNIYPKWYKNIPCDEYLAGCIEYIRANGGAGKPIIISEIGAGAVYGYRTNIRCKWSEEYQLDALDEQLSTVLNNPECSGVIVWQFADCRIDEGWFAKRPKSQNNKGVVDMYRREKLSYAKVKEIFQTV